MANKHIPHYTKNTNIHVVLTKCKGVFMSPLFLKTAVKVYAVSALFMGLFMTSIIAVTLGLSAIIISTYIKV